MMEETKISEKINVQVEREGSERKKQGETQKTNRQRRAKEKGPSSGERWMLNIDNA